MHEELQWHGGLLAYFLDLFQTQLTTKDNLFETKLFQLLHLFHRQVVALRASMKRDGRQVELEQLHVLYDKGIDTRIPAVIGDLAGAFQFAFIQQSIQRHINLGIKQGRVAAKAFDVLNTIRGFFAGTKVRTTDVDGIGAMINGSHAHLHIFGRREQFYLLHIHAAKLRNFETMTIIFLFLQIIPSRNVQQNKGHIICINSYFAVSLPATTINRAIQI